MQKPFQNQPETSENSIFRFELIPSLISIAVISLIAWGLSWIPSEEDIKIGIAIAFGISGAGMLLTIVNIGCSRSAIVIKTTASLFLCIVFLLDIALAIWCLSEKTIIMTNALSLLVFILIAYFIAKTKQ